MRQSHTTIRARDRINRRGAGGINLIVVLCLLAFVGCTGCLGHYVAELTGMNRIIAMVLALIAMCSAWWLFAAIANAMAEHKIDAEPAHHQAEEEDDRRQEAEEARTSE